MENEYDLEKIRAEIDDRMLCTRYAEAASYINDLLTNNTITFIEDDIFYLRSIRCYCIYLNREYHSAIDTVLEVLKERENHKLTLFYLRDIRTLALSQRGLCDFEECSRLLNGAYDQLINIENPTEDVTKLTLEIQCDIEDTNKIINDEPVYGGLRIHSTHVDGPFGIQALGFEDIEIPQSQKALHCQVDQLNIVVLNSNEIEVGFDFVLNNKTDIESWIGNGDNTTPALFMFLLTRGAKIHHGQFDLKFLNEHKGYFHEMAFMQNGFMTIIHPDSYHPRSAHPIPDCKKFRYVRSDCSVFFCQIPNKARVNFKGKITFPNPVTDCREKMVLRNFMLLFPFGSVSVEQPKINSPIMGDFELEDLSIKHVAFRQDQEGFRAGEITFDVPQQIDPIAGPELVLSGDEVSGRRINRTNMDLLSFTMNIKPLKAIIPSLLISSEVIPIGIFNHIPVITARKDPETETHSFWKFSNDHRNDFKRRPVATLILENYSEKTASLAVAIESDILGLHEQESVQIPPWQRRSIPIAPVLDPNSPAFYQWQSGIDISQAIQNHPVKIFVRNEKEDMPIKEISKTYYSKILPPDYMVWSISEPADGRKIDLRLLIAKWVMPNARSVKSLCEGIIRDKINTNPMEDLQRIYDRIAALQIEYDISRIRWGSESEYGYQRVRPPSVSISGRKMCCIDGCVLFASCFEALGYESRIIFVEKHAFVGVINPENKNQVLFIETTCVCTGSGGEQGSFDQAVYMALNRFENEQKYFSPKDSETKLPPGADIYFPFHRIISIEMAREFGITPFEDNEV